MIRSRLSTLRFQKIGFAMAVVGLSLNGGHAYGPGQLMPAPLAYTTDTGFGFSLFASGDAAQLGGASVPFSPKLTYNAGNVWRGSIALPPSTTLTYRFLRRADGPNDIASAGNGTQIGTDVTTTTPWGSAGPLPATKTLYYRSAWVNPLLEVDTGSGSATVPFAFAGAGRIAGESLWRASGFSVGGAKARFRATNGAGLYDEAPTGGWYETFADKALLQDGQIFNYVPAAAVTAARLVTVASFAVPQGLQSRTLRIYLPRGYDSHPTRRYPVIYMHDGQTIFGTAPGGLGPVNWNVDGILTRLIGLGQVREVIIASSDNTSNRTTDYTPPGAPAGGIPFGQGDKYGAFVVNTLKPYIDANYRTLSDRANTGVAGASLGALISSYIALNHSAVFSKVGGFSPAYWANTTSVNDRFATGVIPQWRHYLSNGTTGAGFNGSPDDYNGNMTARDNLMRRGQVHGIDVLHEIGFGEQHNEQAWQNRFPTAARYLLPIEDETPDFSAFETRVGDWGRYQ